MMYAKSLDLVIVHQRAKQFFLNFRKDLSQHPYKSVKLVYWSIYAAGLLSGYFLPWQVLVGVGFEVLFWRHEVELLHELERRRQQKIQFDKEVEAE
jgi:hypothetical protein